MTLTDAEKEATREREEGGYQAYSAINCRQDDWQLADDGVHSHSSNQSPI